MDGNHEELEREATANRQLALSVKRAEGQREVHDAKVHVGMKQCQAHTLIHC